MMAMCKSIQVGPITSVEEVMANAKAKGLCDSIKVYPPRRFDRDGGCTLAGLKAACSEYGGLSRSCCE